MIPRYTLQKMGNLWTELHKMKMWMKAELAGLWAKEQLGEAPVGAYESARKIKITKKIVQRAKELEEVGDHDLIAFVLAVTELLAENARLVFHAGFTSFDIEDTALALVLRDCTRLIKEKLIRLRRVLITKAIEHRNTLQIGRTHFVHAQPITFGFKLLGWVDVIDHHLKRLEEARKEIRVSKFSGAVGTYDVNPEIEKLACKKLGLRPAKISTQIISRDILAHYCSTMVGIFNSLDRFATEIRHLAGTDIGEVAEYKKPGSKGSSAMPGKSRLGNPIKSENTCGLARVSRGYLIPAFECEITWGERSLENSSAEKVYLPDLCIALDFSLNRFAETMEKLEVFPQQMYNNVWKTGGIVFAQRVMIKLTEKGINRDEAYDLLEKLALSVKRGSFRTALGQTFRELVDSDDLIGKMLTPGELNECFDPKMAIKHIDTIFARFGL